MWLHNGCGAGSWLLGAARRKSVDAPRAARRPHDTRTNTHIQVLYRTWGTFTAISVTISAMSVLTSITASLWTGEAVVVRARGRRRRRRRQRSPAFAAAASFTPNPPKPNPNKPNQHNSTQKGLYYGGPAVIVWGWMLVSALMLCVGLGMAELASAYPTSGGMYYCE